MEFKELYDKSMKLWPSEIDISDATVTENGILFQRLSSVWNQIEDKSKLMGEGYDLMSWVIFRNFHNTAKVELKAGRKTIEKAQVNMDKVKHDLIENLQMDGYEDMLSDFRKSNRNF